MSQYTNIISSQRLLQAASLPKCTPAQHFIIYFRGCKSKYQLSSEIKRQKCHTVMITLHTIAGFSHDISCKLRWQWTDKDIRGKFYAFSVFSLMSSLSIPGFKPSHLPNTKQGIQQPLFHSISIQVILLLS